MQAVPSVDEMSGDIAKVPNPVRPDDVGVLAVDYPKGHVIAPHSHEGGQVVFARTGVMQVAGTPGMWIVPPRRGVWIPAGVAHAITCRTAVSMRTVYLSGSPTASLPASCFVFAVSALLRALILDLVERRPEEPRRGHVVALIVDELAALPVAPLHLPLPEDPRLRRLTEALATDPADPRTLDDWARTLGVGRRTLMRRFAAETGMTVGEWRRRLRLIRSVEWLAEERPITVIALDLGYDSPSAFTQAFRRSFGTTPSRYFASPDGPNDRPETRRTTAG